MTYDSTHDIDEIVDNEPRSHGRRVENLGKNVGEWCEQTGNGSSTYDLCEHHARQLDKDPHAYDTILRPYNGDPIGIDGWGGDVAHPNYDDDEYRCTIPDCKVLLTGW